MSDNFHLQLYRGTTAQNNAYTGPAGELTVDTTLSKLRLHDGSTAGGVEIGGMPTGSIIPYAGSMAPAGYLLCDGSAISRSTYSALFAIIGTTYGEGDGNSTFNIPSQNDMPSGTPANRYLVLTPGASGSKYTAPANGWFIARHTATGSASSGNGQTYLWNDNNSAATTSIGVDNTWQSIPVPPLPVKKGDIVNVTFVRSNVVLLRFIYDEGTPSIIKY